MFLTPQILKENKPCVSGYVWFRRQYPQGEELLTVLENHPNFFTPGTLHWVRNHLPLNEQEIQMYEKLVGLVECSSYCLSENCQRSSNIFTSNNVNDSQHIFYSSFVNNSQDVLYCEDVNSSGQIFSSSLITHSSKIFQSKNINESTNIINTILAVNSTNVIDSSTVFNSSEIIKSNNIESSHFCKDCSNLRHCLFCSNIKNKEYYIFNQPVDKEQYLFIEKQYLTLLCNLLGFVDKWPSEILTKDNLPKINDFDKWFLPIPSRFWRWARTLPGFDSMLVYDITMLPEILVD